MTTIATTPARARTDVHETSGPGAGHSKDRIRTCGILLAAGTTSWAIANLVYGFAPSSDPAIAITDLTGLAFQAGVMALLYAQIKTRATGVSRTARGALKVERVLLAVAMLWSLIHGLVPAARDEAWLAALDVFWPLSMLGMFFIGIKVAVTGRWRGRARLWSLLAETWAPICVPAVAILGHGLGDVVGAVHLLLGYATLGAILATRPDLVVDRG
jgi:hypothetical protein